MSRTFDEIWQDVRDAYNLRDGVLLGSYRKELLALHVPTAPGWVMILDGFVMKTRSNEKGKEFFKQAVEYFEPTEDLQGLAYAKREYERCLGNDDPERRANTYRECLDLFLRSGDVQGQAFTSTVLAGYYAGIGKREQALSLFERGSTAHRVDV